jgi:ribosomal protein L28
MFPSLPSLAAALSQPFKRSQLGLFHGKTKQYGNNVPFSKQKTRRTWLPNIQTKRLFSDALGEKVRVKLSMRALKTIRKVCSPSLLFAYRTDNLCSMVASTSMCSKQRRTCWAGRACVYVSQCEKHRNETHWRHPVHHLRRPRLPVVRLQLVRSPSSHILISASAPP